MADTQDDIEILIEEDPAKKPDAEDDPLALAGDGKDLEGKAPEGEGEVKKPLEPEDGIEQLRAKLEASEKATEEANRQKADAERRASEAAAHAGRAAKEVQDSNLALLTNAIETLNQSQDVITGNIAAAMEAGNFTEVAKLQRQMSDNSAKLLQLEAGKTALEEEAKRPSRETQTDPTEAIASQLTPRSAAWVRAHPEYTRDPNKYRRMVAAHELALTDGHEADSDAYFAAVEATLGLRKPGDQNGHDDGAESGAARSTGGRSAAAPPAAPASRSTPDNNGRRTNTVRLTPQEVEMAEMMGMSPQEYAKNKRDLQAEGKLH